ncbi:MAG TPA: chloride channel protein [Myxococcota bacterium]|nr:chloride channel protein [Myxococcota bacterium]
MAWLRLWVARMAHLRARWVAFGIVVGLCCGLAASAFFVALELATRFTTVTLVRELPPPPPPGDALLGEAPTPDGPPRRWLFFLLPGLGGLAAGLLVTWLAPEAEGTGTDEMIRAFHRSRGVIRSRVPLVKAAATILTLSSGGSAGKEGPVAQVGAGIGSGLASLLGLSARDRRILLLAGTAGGLGAIFRAPLGSAVTAIEVVYREDFESEAVVPAVISSVTAYVVFGLLLGSHRIFATHGIPHFRPIELPGYVLLALLSAPVGRAYIGLFRLLRHRVFARLSLPRPLRPMLGGLCVGAIGLAVPEAWGAGWGWLQRALDGQVAVQSLALIVAAKIATTALTVGSGGSGGVFGPTLFIGGMLGALVGYTGAALAPALFPHPASFVLVGMASFFAGVASAPIGAMLMVAEMSGGYALLAPLVLVSVLAMLLARGSSIYENQVKDRFSSPAHLADLTVNVLEEMKVGDVYRPSESLVSVAPSTRFAEVRAALLGASQGTLPVVDTDGTLTGLVTAEQLRPVLDEPQLDGIVVASDLAGPPLALLRDDDLYRAHELFRSSAYPQLPVVEASDGEGPPRGRILGMLDYRDMMHAYHLELQRRRES